MGAGRRCNRAFGVDVIDRPAAEVHIRHAIGDLLHHPVGDLLPGLPGIRQHAEIVHAEGRPDHDVHALPNARDHGPDGQQLIEPAMEARYDGDAGLIEHPPYTRPAVAEGAAAAPRSLRKDPHTTAGSEHVDDPIHGGLEDPFAAPDRNALHAPHEPAHERALEEVALLGDVMGDEVVLEKEARWEDQRVHETVVQDGDVVRDEQKRQGRPLEVMLALDPSPVQHPHQHGEGRHHDQAAEAPGDGTVQSLAHLHGRARPADSSRGGVPASSRLMASVGPSRRRLRGRTPCGIRSSTRWRQTIA